MNRHVVLSIASLLMFIGTGPARAEAPEPFYRGIGGTLGASYEYGRLKDTGMNLIERGMTAQSLEALLGYRFDERWLLGVDFDYRFQQQQTPLRDAGNTNLAGRGYLLGVGGQYRFSPYWALQLAIDVMGRYDFDKNTANDLDDHLHAPLGARAKLQYFLGRRLSVDAAAGYQEWAKFHVGGRDRDETAKQWMVGLGLTYHFGFGDQHAAEPVESPAPPPPPIATPAVAEVDPATPEPTAAEDSPVVASFASDSTALTGEAKQHLAGLAHSLKVTRTKITLDGYADSSGSERLNKTLSRDRAARVRRALIANGVKASRIHAVGRGSANPVADNDTPEGRAQNRRVELHEN